MGVGEGSHAGMRSAGRGNTIAGVDRAGDRKGNGRVTNLRTAGTRHRPRQHRLDGAQEGGGLFLMSDVAGPILEEPAVTIFDTARLEHGGRPAPRFLTRGTVDAGQSTAVPPPGHASKITV